jgi:hypothetical protein
MLARGAVADIRALDFKRQPDWTFTNRVYNFYNLDGVTVYGVGHAEFYVRFPLDPLRGWVGRSGEKVSTLCGYLRLYARNIVLFPDFKHEMLFF